MTRETTKLKVIVGFSSAVLIVLLAVFVAYSSFKDLMQAVNTLALPDQKLAKLNTILTDISATENSIRTYVLLQDPKLLHECGLYFSSVEKNLDTLKSLTSATSYYINKIDTLSYLWQQKKNDLNQIVTLYKNKPQLFLSPQTIQDIAPLQRSSKIITINKTHTSSNNSEEEEISKGPISTPYDKQGLFSSLRRVFKKKPIELPPLVVPNVQEQIQVDSIVVLKAEKDTSLQLFLKKFTLLKNKENRHLQQLTKSELAIVSRNKIILDRITDIILTLRQEELKASKENVSNSKAVADKSTSIIVVLSCIGFLSTIFFIWLILKDITKSNFYKQQLIQATRQATKVAASKEEFLSYMSHEIRTPLNSIIGFTEQLSHVSLPNKDRVFLSAISASSDHLMSTVNDILDFSKIEAGKLTIERIPFAFTNAVAQVHESLQLTAKQKNLDFRFSTSPNLPAWVIGDPFRLKQILYNLLSNALKFTALGKVEVHVNCKTISKNQVSILIEITDTGIGIAEERIKNIFSGFSQAEASTPRKYGGSGLGLYITKKLATMQHGKLFVKSRLNIGTTFAIELPYEVCYTPELQIATPIINVPSRTVLKDKKVLLVDDDELTVLLLHTIFKKWQINLHVAENAKDAFNAFNEQKFDLIVSDLHLPDGTGLELIRKIRMSGIASASDIPSFIITADVLENYVAIAADLSIHSIILKPFKEEIIFEKLSSAFHLPVTTITSQNTSASVSFSTNIDYSLKELRKFSDNDPQALQHILQTLTSNTKRDLEKLKLYAASNQWNEVAELAHKLSSAFAHLQAHHVFEQLKSLQELILTGKNAVYMEDIETLFIDASLVLEKVEIEMIEIA